MKIKIGSDSLGSSVSKEQLSDRLDRKEIVRGTALTITGGFLWGLAGVFGKYSFEYKGVMAPWLVNVRLIIAGIILLMRAYMVQKNGIFRIWKNKRHVFRMLVYGVIGIAGCQMTYTGFKCRNCDSPAIHGTGYDYGPSGNQKPETA